VRRDKKKLTRSPIAMSADLPSSPPFSGSGSGSPEDLNGHGTPNQTGDKFAAFTSFVGPEQATLLPKFLNYREMLTFLYSNKGVDLAPVKNIISSYNIEALVEVIAFILDRPISPDEMLHLYSPEGPLHTTSTKQPLVRDQDGNVIIPAGSNPTVIKFGAENKNVELTDLHQNVLLPGQRNHERDVIDYLGLAHQCRQQSHGTFPLISLFLNQMSRMDVLYLWDIMRIIRSRNWMDELYLGSTFRDAVYNSPFRHYIQSHHRPVDRQRTP
jgi:hypothetical protein